MAQVRAKLLAHDPWLIEMLEHHQRLLNAQQRRINQLEAQIARESNYDALKVAKRLGETTFVLCNAKRLTGSASGTLNRSAVT